MSLAGKLKKLRVEKRESLQQVADGVGVSKAHIWELETGKSDNPGLDLLRRLASHFKVTIAFLTDDAVMPEDAAPVQFFREYEGKLTDKDWAALRGMADLLKDKSK